MEPRSMMSVTCFQSLQKRNTKYIMEKRRCKQSDRERQAKLEIDTDIIRIP